MSSSNSSNNRRLSDEDLEHSKHAKIEADYIAHIERFAPLLESEELRADVARSLATLCIYPFLIDTISAQPNVFRNLANMLDPKLCEYTRFSATVLIGNMCKMQHHIDTFITSHQNIIEHLAILLDDGLQESTRRAVANTFANICFSRGDLTNRIVAAPFVVFNLTGLLELWREEDTCRAAIRALTSIGCVQSNVALIAHQPYILSNLAKLVDHDNLMRCETTRRCAIWLLNKISRQRL